MTLNANAEAAELSVTYATQQGCACPICAGSPQDAQAALVPDAGGTVQIDEQGFLLDVSNPASGLVGTTMPNGLRILSSIESAIQIARPSSWASHDADLELTYSVSADGVAEGFAFDAAYQAATRRIFDFYEDISGLRFREIEAGSTEAPNMKLYNIDQRGGGGWAGFPGPGTKESGIGFPWTPGDVNEGSYVYLTLIHEIGHLLGLHHPGNYNGSVDYLTQAVYWNDSKQYSVMSYMGEGITGADFAGSAATPMLFDILAIQLEYGINWTTRAGDTTYGFNSNSGVAAYGFTAADKTSAFTIWDGAGTDTLDFSGFATGTVMDLRQGGFSSTGLETYNVAIAYNAVIENAVGGTGNDRMRGNEVGNLLQGGGGNDVLYGGADDDPPATPDPRGFTGISLNHDVLERGQYLSLANVQSLSSPQLSVEVMLTLDRVPDSAAAILSYAVEGNSNEFLLEAGSQGTLRLIIDGQTRYDTPILTRSLADGEPHRISLTWDSQTGAVAFYIDGELAHEGVYSASVGRAIASGGTLVIGQEQDSVGGGFQSDQYLPGSVGDIRIFNDIRTAAEVAEHAFGTLTGAEQGLVNNWQVYTADATHVADTATANPAVNLTDLMPLAFTASQSSQYSASHAAGNVLDNSLSTQNHTKAGPDEWLLVSLNQPMEVTHIQVQNVTGWASRLNGATVSVLDVEGNVLHTWAPISGEGYWGSNLTFRLPEPMQIGAVRINHQNQNLHVTEINIFGHAPDGVGVPAALLNTDLTIHGGATPGEVGAPGSAARDDDTLQGGLGDDSLSGGAGQDDLQGDAGDDTLDGGAGADLLHGGEGNDTYRVDARDQISESRDQGTDLVEVSASYALGRNLEDLTLTGTAHLKAIGNALANVLTGNAGNNLLNGGLGNDTMVGGAGRDTYIVNATGDRVFETTTTLGTIDAGGIDRVQSSVTFNLDATNGVRFVERLTLSGADNIDGTGNALANVIAGNAGNNVLNGGLGSDKLIGREGHDTFVFNTAFGSGNVDRIRDFTVIDDTLHLDDAIFAGLATGNLAVSAFAANLTGEATDLLHRIIYETDTGRLFYDADGSASGARIQFATVTANLLLTNADFLVV